MALRQRAAAYVLVKRVFNGDWRDEESEACDAALDASIVLAAERVGPIPEVQCARDAVLSVVRRASPADAAPSRRRPSAPSSATSPPSSPPPPPPRSAPFSISSGVSDSPPRSVLAPSARRAFAPRARRRYLALAPRRRRRWRRRARRLAHPSRRHRRRVRRRKRRKRRKRKHRRHPRTARLVSPTPTARPAVPPHARARTPSYKHTH